MLPCFAIVPAFLLTPGDVVCTAGIAQGCYCFDPNLVIYVHLLHNMQIVIFLLIQYSI